MVSCLNVNFCNDSNTFLLLILSYGYYIPFRFFLHFSCTCHIIKFIYSSYCFLFGIFDKFCFYSICTRTLAIFHSLDNILGFLFCLLSYVTDVPFALDLWVVLQKSLHSVLLMFSKSHSLLYIFLPRFISYSKCLSESCILAFLPLSFYACFIRSFGYRNLQFLVFSSVLLLFSFCTYALFLALL
ncbi:hypothetical protein ILUMI_01503 [Ignelater luminosus]|uniref:Uncharacterized protein n=1 Tax=Ignelater luminosus TaxID=2038154 RepID=A0A8K0DF94_IGNLU|nr:hypothetical protein ILUMI_01503 [Ignelater luminosus]